MVCNTTNAWWLLLAALIHPQARPTPRFHGDRVPGGARQDSADGIGANRVVVCNTTNAWWLLVVVLSHPQARPAPRFRGDRVPGGARQDSADGIGTLPLSASSVWLRRNNLSDQI
ncbi:MAG TPA: hypothetical protein VMW72_15170 [Sedimentisphaerales bacterium]|nr:hypothetical protein [Sedimentisphaerales bacterium]